MEIPLVLTIIFTILAPFVTAFLNRVQWSSKTKNLVAIAVSVAISVLYLLMTGGIGDWSQLGVVIPAVYSLQQVIYAFFLKNAASKFEALTTPNSIVVAPSTTAGLVTVSSDATIKSGEDKTEVNPPVTIAPDPVVITSETPAKG